RPAWPARPARPARPPPPQPPPGAPAPPCGRARIVLGVEVPRRRRALACVVPVRSGREFCLVSLRDDMAVSAAPDQRTGANGDDQGRYQAFMAALVRRLPFGLSRIVAASFLGYVIINGLTFSVDLGLLTVFHGVFGWPLPLAITLAYLMAF